MEQSMSSQSSSHSYKADLRMNVLDTICKNCKHKPRGGKGVGGGSPTHVSRTLKNRNNASH